MVYVTGDIHGAVDWSKLFEFEASHPQLTKDDYMIICGDFGIPWRGIDDPKDNQLLDAINDLPWTTLFVDGNHENFVELNKYPQISWHGGVAQKLRDSVYHLCRGEVYEIDGKTYFAMGGAESIDKMRRLAYVSWWAEEVPTAGEMAYAISSLAKYNNKVDYILTHTIPHRYVPFVVDGYIDKVDPLTRFLTSILENVEFKCWYAGHFHVDHTIETNKGKIQLLYHTIVAVE